MRLASYLVDGQPRAGVVAADQTLVAVSDLVAGGPTDMLAVLAAGPSLWDRLRAAAPSARGGQALSSARLVAPIPRPRRNLFCVGWNYSEHFDGGQWFKGKSFDSHAPLGPWIVTADELSDPHSLHITLRVNGVTKQDSNTKFMVFRIPRIIKELSTGVMLEPGDVVLTGTPEGVGFTRKPPEFLRVGDVMEAEIEQIGVLRNTVATYGD
jgi:2-keto-4-pentenoate hydratase/2-oxohepta-3-ene-1,7-dioic acid hydratase in catechol pathway